MAAATTTHDTFAHEALLYAGEDEFLAAAVPFVREGVEAGEAVLVVVACDRIAALRDALDGAAAAVRFADMDQVGRNPARIIPEWRDFVCSHAGERIRGIGEPIARGRSADELVECHRHESLLNVAFAETPGFTLLCPYDTQQLAPAVVEEARRTHPRLRADGASYESDSFAGIEAARAPFAAPLPDPPVAPLSVEFDVRSLARVRSVVGDMAVAAGVARREVGDLVLAVSELAANSIRHGGGRGRLRAWGDGAAFVCEVWDEGRILDPMAGRRRPAGGQVGGYGLWLANQVCDLVQVRTYETGGVVRLHMRVDRAGSESTPLKGSDPGEASLGSSVPPSGPRRRRRRRHGKS